MKTTYFMEFIGSQMNRAGKGSNNVKFYIHFGPISLGLFFFVFLLAFHMSLWMCVVCVCVISNAIEPKCQRFMLLCMQHHTHILIFKGCLMGISKAHIVKSVNVCIMWPSRSFRWRYPIRYLCECECECECEYECVFLLFFICALEWRSHLKCFIKMLPKRS